MRIALTIAGSDSSGGAGIQADIEATTAHGVYAMSAITASAVQNTTDVAGIAEVTPSFLKGRPDDIFTDTFPDVVKIGMVSSGDLTEAIGDRLTFCRTANAVMDPVMISTSDSRFIDGETIGTLKEVLLPIADLLTSNIPETEVLSGMEVHSPGDMEKAARAIRESHDCVVLPKSGHRPNDANDLLYRHKKLKWFNGRQINNPNTHGTGCALSSAIASNLAKDMNMDLAVERIRVYLSGALEAQLDLGKGSGSMNHGFVIRGGY